MRWDRKTANRTNTVQKGKHNLGKNWTTAGCSEALPRESSTFVKLIWQYHCVVT